MTRIEATTRWMSARQGKSKSGGRSTLLGFGRVRLLGPVPRRADDTVECEVLASNAVYTGNYVRCQVGCRLALRRRDLYVTREEQAWLHAFARLASGYEAEFPGDRPEPWRTEQRQLALPGVRA